MGLITKRKLLDAQPENVLRLARSLHLRTDGMSRGQVARLVHWRITRPVYRFADPQKRAEYLESWQSITA